MVFYFFMHPESVDPEETGLNSNHLKYLLLPYFKQLWFSGFTWTTQSQRKAEGTRLTDLCTRVVRTQDLFVEATDQNRFSQSLLFNIQDFNLALLPNWNQTGCTHTEAQVRGCCLALFVAFIFAEPSCYYSCRSNKQTTFWRRAPVLPVLSSDIHLSSAIVSDSSEAAPSVQVPGFHSPTSPRRSADLLQLLQSGISAVPPYIWYSNSCIQIPHIYSQSALPGELK